MEFRPIILLLLILILMRSCTDNGALERQALLLGGLKAARERIVEDTKQYYYAVEDRTKDPSTAAKAKMWLPVIGASIRQRSKMESYIDSLQSVIKSRSKRNSSVVDFDGNDKNAVKRLFYNEHQLDTMMSRIRQYKRTLLSLTIPPEFSKDSLYLKYRQTGSQELEESVLTGFAVNEDSVGRSTDSMALRIKNAFQGATAWAAINILLQVKVEIALGDRTIAQFCYFQTPSYHRGYEAFRVIAAQNSKLLSPGEKLEITAGVGAFSVSAQPEIKINGQVIPVGVDGIAMYTMTVQQTPGSYSIPLVIEFYKPSGDKEKFSTTIKYKIADN